MIHIPQFCTIPSVRSFNLSVISSYGFRDGRLKRPKDVLQFFVLPLLGFASIGALWLEVEETSLKAGISWAAVGLIYLGWLTKGFRRAAPQLHEEDFER